MAYNTRTKKCIITIIVTSEKNVRIIIVVDFNLNEGLCGQIAIGKQEFRIKSMFYLAKFFNSAPAALSTPRKT